MSELPENPSTFRAKSFVKGCRGGKGWGGGEGEGWEGKVGISPTSTCD